MEEFRNFARSMMIAGLMIVLFLSIIAVWYCIEVFIIPVLTLEMKYILGGIGVWIFISALVYSIRYGDDDENDEDEE